MPRFSVIIATRNRPSLFADALESVVNQSYQDFEIIVVNDGSAHEHLEAYEGIYVSACKKIGDRFHVHRLVRRSKGHGQSYSINFGADQAAGEYLCFLDDDDFWTDRKHLERTANILASHPGTDLYMANQCAFLGDKRVSGPIWLEALESELRAKGKQPDRHGAFEVGIDDLMSTHGFCHVNCLIVRKTLFHDIGGMDEGIRWENDRDLFLRLIDRAEKMIHCPSFVSHHRVPDPIKTQNMTTALSMIEKRLMQIRVLDKAALFAMHARIRSHARQHKGYALKKIAEEIARNGDWRNAAAYAREALAFQPGFKWLGFTLYCNLRNITALLWNTS